MLIRSISSRFKNDRLNCWFKQPSYTIRSTTSTLDYFITLVVNPNKSSRANFTNWLFLSQSKKYKAQIILSLLSLWDTYWREELRKESEQIVSTLSWRFHSIEDKMQCDAIATATATATTRNLHTWEYEVYETNCDEIKLSWYRNESCTNTTTRLFESAKRRNYKLQKKKNELISISSWQYGDEERL